MAETVQDAAAKKPASKSKKMIMIVAVVMAQLVVAYFLVGFFLSHGGPGSHSSVATASAQTIKAKNDSGGGNFDHVFMVKDLIVNPAGTNGLRFLLTTIGLEVTSAQTEKECEKRNVEIHDSIINILTSKTLPDLDAVDSRDTLKAEIRRQINKDLVTGRVLNVYFSKFIIQ